MPTLPPGPKLAFMQSLGYLKDPYAFSLDLAARYGDPVTVPTLNGTIVMTGHPEGIREIFSAQPATFAGWAADWVQPIVGADSLFCTSGDLHQARRKLNTPPFLPEQLTGLAETLVHIVKERTAALPADQPVHMQGLAEGITLEALLTAMLGDQCAAERQLWQETLMAMVAAAHPSILFFPALRQSLGGYGPWATFRRARQRFDALVADEIAHRRKGAAQPDVLGMLIASRDADNQPLSDAMIRDQLVTLVVAGHETTGSALAWVFYWLDRHPEVQQRLRAELTKLGPTAKPMAVAALPYLEAVCHEALRLNPVVPAVMRTLLEPITLRGYELPAGLAVCANTVVAHANPRTYPDPFVFRPERFLERSFSPYEYLPFGGGSRRCIGSAMALLIMKLTVATLLQAYDCRRTSHQALSPVRGKITMGPAGGVEMVLQRRTAPVLSGL